MNFTNGYIIIKTDVKFTLKQVDIAIHSEESRRKSIVKKQKWKI